MSNNEISYFDESLRPTPNRDNWLHSYLASRLYVLKCTACDILSEYPINQDVKCWTCRNIINPKPKIPGEMREDN